LIDFELHFKGVVNDVEDWNAMKQEMKNMGATWISCFKKKGSNTKLLVFSFVDEKYNG